MLLEMQKVNTQQSSVTSPPIHATFNGEINEANVNCLIDNLSKYSNPVGETHLLFNSYGGTVDNGILLYNYFKSYRRDLKIYNSGMVASAGVTAFIGVKKENRFVSQTGSFMIHLSYQMVNATLAYVKDCNSVSKYLKFQNNKIKKLYASESIPVYLLSDFNRYIDSNEATKSCNLANRGDWVPLPNSLLFDFNKYN